MNQRQNFLKGIFSENPIFVIMLGMCSTLAITKTLEGAIGMGVSVIFVLVFSNVVISLIKNIVPNDIRIPVYIVVIATLVTVVEMILNAYFTSLYRQLGIFVSLIVVNCIILGRAEAFANKNTVWSSFIDGLGMGIGYTFALFVVALIREVLGTGTITVWGDLKFNLIGAYNFLHIKPTGFFVDNAGAFLVLGLLIGGINSAVNAMKAKQAESQKAAQTTKKEVAK